jgi:hypothetical protein
MNSIATGQIYPVVEGKGIESQRPFRQLTAKHTASAR